MPSEKQNYTNQSDIFVRDGDQVSDGVQTYEILSHEDVLFIMRILYGVTSTIAVFGVTGNIFSIIILLKHGLHKCSNILLICLAISDLIYLISYNSAPKMIYEVVGVENGFDYSRNVSWALFIMFQIFTVLDYTFGAVSLTSPMLITFERLVAVYLPFKFNRIITPTRTWCAVGVLSIFWLTCWVYASFWWAFTYTYDVNYNITVGRSVRSSLYYNNQVSVRALEGTLDYITMKISPMVTLVGCILITVKVRTAAIRRKQMSQTNSEDVSKSTSRTTRMLLAVCVVYVITCVILSLPIYFSQYLAYGIFSDSSTTNLSPIIYQVINVAVCINSSANFVVYVGMNKNFRDTYKSLFTICGGSRR